MVAALYQIKFINLAGLEEFYFGVQKQFISNITTIFFIIDLTASGRDQVPLLLQVWARGTVHAGHKWVKILSEVAFIFT